MKDIYKKINNLINSGQFDKANILLLPLLKKDPNDFQLVQSQFLVFLSKKDEVNALKTLYKMSELKDIISNITDNEVLYEWENKFDHQLFITFSYNENYIKYELNVNDLYLKKFNNENLIYDNTLSSLEDGLNIIYKEVTEIVEEIK